MLDGALTKNLKYHDYKAFDENLSKRHIQLFYCHIVSTKYVTSKSDIT